MNAGTIRAAATERSPTGRATGLAILSGNIRSVNPLVGAQECVNDAHALRERFEGYETFDFAELVR